MTKRFVLGLFLALTLGLAVSACGGSGEEAAPTEAAPAETAPEETGAAETGAEAAPANQITTVNGPVTIDPHTMYRLELGFAFRHVGTWFRPNAKENRLRGDALLMVAATTKEGTFINVAPLS